MTTLEFLLELRRLGVEVWLAGGRVRCSAPVGVLTDEWRDALAQRKDAIQALLEASAPSATAGAIPLQPDGSRRPLFAVPGHNGDVFCFVPLARHLGTAQPFYGLQPPGLDAGEAPLRRIEELADYFIKAVRSVQPKGPYQLGGYCLGGLTAFEMARRLRLDGEEVSLLALFSTLAPTALTPYNWHKAALEYWIAERAHGVRSFLAASGAERIGKLTTKAARLWPGVERQEHDDDPQALRKRGLEDTTIAAARRYQPSAYPGRLTMFAANSAAVRTADRPLDWRGYAAEFEVCYGPDTCNGNSLLREPSVGDVARHLLVRLGAEGYVPSLRRDDAGRPQDRIFQLKEDKSLPY